MFKSRAFRGPKRKRAAQTSTNMTLNCRGELLDLTQPKVMGILNLTPDSFYDGGRYNDQESIVLQAGNMLNEGATFIDLGGYSSRPGADEVPLEEEIQRVIPVISLLRENYPGVLISVDTFRSEVARKALEAGAAMINDITAGNGDEKMMQVVGEFQAPYVMMHMRGNPKTMQELTSYDNLFTAIGHYFSEKIAEAHDHGIKDCILDPGFGFAKTLDQNYHLLAQLEVLSEFGFPVLAGLSRKSMIYKFLGVDPDQSLNGTTVLNTYALQKGACILRVHDVQAAMECITLHEKLKESLTAVN
ncbi:dihydropteroate synthase [Zeaxanthinibacter enoshimensis]|uniref:Dihydropteroate synthase n=1 Tax=Zeaxanthinibacter enoshimensis TaxID=392009 RepID=A0A4R6TIN8_9FLAO|nr:dihydropteroate synthase [Zeaxanthinibacter enoshimensis]TDQ29130.1 dihydropteroate synthase [Zeaxanthinibacter enoshimensis]